MWHDRTVLPQEEFTKIPKCAQLICANQSLGRIYIHAVLLLEKYGSNFANMFFYTVCHMLYH